MRGPTLFDGEHAPKAPARLPLPDVFMLAETEPVRLGLKYHSVVCIRTRKPTRPRPAGLAGREFGLEHSLAAFGIAQFE